MTSIVPTPDPAARVRALQEVADLLHTGLLSGRRAQTLVAALAYPAPTVDVAMLHIRRLGVALRAGDSLLVRSLTWALLHAPGLQPDPDQIATRNRPLETVAAQPAAVGAGAAL